MFDFLMAIKYNNMQFISIRKQWNIGNQYLYETMCHYLSGNGYYFNSRASMIIKIPLIFTLGI